MTKLQYIPKNMHTVFALLCFVVVIHWLIFPYPSGLLHWHCGNLTIAPVPAKQPWWIWIKTSCEFIMNDCITTTKQSTTKPCAYFLGYTVLIFFRIVSLALRQSCSCSGTSKVSSNNMDRIGFHRNTTKIPERAFIVRRMYYTQALHATHLPVEAQTHVLVNTVWITDKIQDRVYAVFQWSHADFLEEVWRYVCCYL